MQQDALISAPEPPVIELVARVLLDSPVPHLDRPFDYIVPPSLHEQAGIGMRVKVPFSGRQLDGFITELQHEVRPVMKLRELGKIVSDTRVLFPEVLECAELVAERYAGTLWDVVRQGIPPRAARVEKETREPAELVLPEVETNQLSHYEGGPELLQALAEGRRQRVVTSWVPNFPGSWPGFILDAARPVLGRGKAVLVIVPDAADLERLGVYLDETIGQSAYARLQAEDGPTLRYRNFLRAIGGEVPLVIGTRSAALCHLPDLELVIIWQDNDQSHREQRAPYQHSREVVLLRSQHSGCSLLVASSSRSVEAQRLVDTGWAAELKLPRQELRSRVARVAATTSDFELDRDPVLAHARIPSLAWREASKALETGPVLVQVARTGFMPALACQDCRSYARCPECQGPLQLSGAGGAVNCKWCGTFFRNHRCAECSSPRIRALSIGADRTAEELGQAFAKVPVISSTGAKPVRQVPDKPALVVATPGAEPTAAAGYGAVLLLDADKMMAHDSLRNAEQVMARWFTAAALARAQGVVVLTGNPTPAGAALVRWDPAGFAERELAERHQVGLPPAVRSAIISGPGAERFVAALTVPVRVHGPAINEQSHEHRYVLFFSYADGAQVTAALRALRARMSAAKEPVVNIAVDPDEVL
ncbi:primosomal protein PriA [Glutamicibacter sp. MNS18]|uniref:primosomal protein N' family DNA-binding protein n=1 Tax=Glutamicibacter sp. MNS18 TaxID=2989817 RepID=UPI0022369874|nr:primosomal protein PriA [Glutamicibacter sp. MNS18]MCW4464816.1 primosomal protein PriA [Glutamicibacter sp. MNS18]